MTGHWALKELCRCSISGVKLQDSAGKSPLKSSSFRRWTLDIITKPVSYYIPWDAIKHDNTTSNKKWLHIFQINAGVDISETHRQKALIINPETQFLQCRFSFVPTDNKATLGHRDWPENLASPPKSLEWTPIFALQLQGTIDLYSQLDDLVHRNRFILQGGSHGHRKLKQDTHSAKCSGSITMSLRCN
ncbi:hypothetical protein JCM33374_g5062 [Metschnikowia sp. JCM 33374]|nr:hypothetical protein JCM33374_g5062 [Metschnikowia sp. JCM 33374]